MSHVGNQATRSRGYEDKINQVMPLPAALGKVLFPNCRSPGRKQAMQAGNWQAVGGQSDCRLILSPLTLHVSIVVGYPSLWALSKLGGGNPLMA